AARGSFLPLVPIPTEGENPARGQRAAEAGKPCSFSTTNEAAHSNPKGLIEIPTRSADIEPRLKGAQLSPANTARADAGIHNVTPAESRTARLSDSPQGCS